MVSNMEEQHITIETALIAKEKGFTVAEIDFHNSTFYALDSSPLYSEDALGLPSMFTYTDWFCGYDGSYEGPSYKEVIAFATTQSFLQKWLRDIHNIYIFVNFFSLPYRNVGFGFHIIRDHDGRIENEFNHNDDLYSKYCGGVGLGEGLQFKTYEEALETGLQECLNLIK